MSISLDKLKDLGHSPDRNACLVPIPRALADIPALVVDSLQEQDLRQGRRICASGLYPQVRRGGVVLCLAQDRRLVALAEVVDPDVLAPKKVMNSI
jgi:tRNA U55 pseudouridine synthase TruB